ncbi:MAG: hypothetical protein RQ731_07055 [Anaerosomatales bacterium]|nr:hypothetical protein [Anaerosomatales bacterium]MDT8434493.1 hypothetical protein [Anaerosomatales bacterium]
MMYVALLPGMDEGRTYINSGHVIFRSDSADAVKAVLNELPDTWVNDDSAKCDVILLGEDVDAPEVLEQLVIKPDIDDVRDMFREPFSGAWSVRSPGAA